MTNLYQSIYILTNTESQGLARIDSRFGTLPSRFVGKADSRGVRHGRTGICAGLLFSDEDFLAGALRRREGFGGESYREAGARGRRSTAVIARRASEAEVQ